jgi:hypothetical protein
VVCFVAAVQRCNLVDKLRLFIVDVTIYSEFLDRHRVLQQPPLVVLPPYVLPPLGVCGTDPYFMMYASGVFDVDTCCVEQNHALTLVGYGHDETTGLDYWLAQNRYVHVLLVKFA